MEMFESTITSLQDHNINNFPLADAKSNLSYWLGILEPSTEPVVKAISVPMRVLYDMMLNDGLGNATQLKDTVDALVKAVTDLANVSPENPDPNRPRKRRLSDLASILTNYNGQ